MSIRIRKGCPLGYFEKPPCRWCGSQEHAEADCAKKPAPPPPWAPGNLVGHVLHALGYEQTADCGCAEFAAKMNQWGWWGCCRKHHQEIVDWFTTKARERGIPVDQARLPSLIWAGVKDLRRRKRLTAPASPAPP